MFFNELACSFIFLFSSGTFKGKRTVHELCAALSKATVPMKFYEEFDVFGRVPVDNKHEMTS